MCTLYMTFVGYKHKHWLCPVETDLDKKVSFTPISVEKRINNVQESQRICAYFFYLFSIIVSQ